MSVPDFQALMLPLLTIAGDGGSHSMAEVVERLSDEFQLTDEDRSQLLRKGGTRIYNRVGWSVTYLKKAGLLRAAGTGKFEVTDRGRETLSEAPRRIDIGFLESRFPEFKEFRKGSSHKAPEDEPVAIFNHADGTWQMRGGVQDRVGATLERYIPDEHTRHAVLSLFAAAVEMSDEERRGAWYVREADGGLRLTAGRLLACEISRSRLRVGVLGPINDEVRDALGSESDRDTEFKLVPGGLLITFPVQNAALGLKLLREDLHSFIEGSVATVRSAVSLDQHDPEALVYISAVIGRDLPQPIPEIGESDDEGDEDSDDDETLSRQPKIRGRPPIFELANRSIGSLLSEIERNVIALPDLQRPFVWEDTGARQLLDSLFLGFPIGTLVFWHVSDEIQTRAIGTERRVLRATTLVIDGQQRLTSLLAVIKGVDVVGKTGQPRKIEIAFRPRDGRFAVSDAAVRNDPEFLSNVTDLWDGRRLLPEIRKDLLNGLQDKGRVMDEDYTNAVEHNLARAHAITDYRLPTVEIRKTAATRDEIADEDVAEIFVRLNNQGTRLGQADFVLTLLSVFHGDLRDRIEERSRVMSQGSVVSIDTQQLLRAACAVAFGRARMSAMYRFLRGVDPTTP